MQPRTDPVYPEDDDPDDLNFFDAEDFDAPEDCPQCGVTYDDADADYLICSRCGWDENEQVYRPGSIDRRHNPFDL